MKNKKGSCIFILSVVTLFFIAAVPGFGLSAEAPAKDQSKTLHKNPYDASEKIKIQEPIRDGGSSGTYDPGIDLVVLKVEMRRGVFGTNPDSRIRIIPTIKNMWRGRTSERIKIWFDGLSRAVWVEGGIGREEEKRGSAIYLSDDGTGEFPLRFHVEVDNNNAIEENNDHNNRCENVSFGPAETNKTHNCPIRGPHDGIM